MFYNDCVYDDKCYGLLDYGDGVMEEGDCDDYDGDEEGRTGVSTFTIEIIYLSYSLSRSFFF